MNILNNALETAIEDFVIACFEHGNTECEWIYAICDESELKKNHGVLALTTMTGLPVEEIKVIAKRALAKHAEVVRKERDMEDELMSMQRRIY